MKAGLLLQATCLLLIASCAPEPSGSTLELATIQEAYFRGAYDSAAADFTRLRETAAARGDAHTAAAATTWMGLTARADGRYDEARRLGEEAVDAQRAQGFDDLLPRSYNLLGLLAWEEFRLEDAEQAFLRAIEAAEASGQDYLLAVANGNLGLVRQDFGDFDGAREGYAHQLRVAEEHDSVRAAGTSRLNLAILSIREGHARDALDDLSRVIDDFRALDDPLRLQVALAQLGEAYADLGEPRRALVAFDSAIAVATRAGMEVEAIRNRSALASLHESIGNDRRALQLFEDVAEALSYRGLDIEGAWSLRSAAAIRARLGDAERAWSDATTAAAVHEEAGLALEQIGDRILLAEIARLRGRPDEAAEALASAEATAHRIGHAPSLLRLALVRARFALDDGRPRQALAELGTRASALHDATVDVRAEGLGLLARALSETGDPARAAEVGREAVEAIERVRSRFGSAEGRATYLAGRQDVYGDLASVLFGMGRIDEAFAVVDAARGRGITARISSAEARSPAVAQVAESDQMLGRIAHLTAKLDTLAGDDLALARVRSELDEARRAYDRAFRDARERAGTDAALLALEAADLGRVQGALLPGEALLEYLVAEDRLWVIVVTSDLAAPLSTEVSEEELIGRVRIARDLMVRRGAQDMLRPVLAELHELLVGPARRSGHLEGVAHLVVVPHRSLNYLPFAALIDPGTDRYLVEDYALSYLPSAASLPALRARPAPPAEAGPYGLFAPLDDDLPHTRVEVQAIADIVSERTSTGRRATEARVREALRRPGVVHLATHGVMNARNPMFSRLELRARAADDPANDGRLEVHEVLDLTIESSLVFLSGCDTGIGSSWATLGMPGEDQTTLERAFLYAGAASVVATLWPIDDRGAAALASHFYAAAADSQARRLALAQRTLLAGGEWAHPFYWAGYRLSGAVGG